MRISRCLYALTAALALSSLPVFADTTIDTSRTMIVRLPTSNSAFTTPDGKSGWVRKLGSDAIPTPAFANNRIFTGASMSSRTFLALNAATGATVWQKTTTDNGPTSAIVSGKYLSYNTESCDTETRDEESGELLWSQLTGGTLLTQPVIVADMLVIPHPTMTRKAQMADDAFRMLGVDLKTGQKRWDVNMTGDVLAAPIAAKDLVLFTCTDGRLFCINTRSGGEEWHVKANANSAPVLAGNIVAVTTEDKSPNGTTVSIRRFSAESGRSLDDKPLAPTLVGNAILTQTQRAEWDYQGPKIAAAHNRLFASPGQTINCVDAEKGVPLWKTTLKGRGLSNGANSLTPVALGNEKLFLGTAKGDVLALKQSDGSYLYGYNVGQPLASQPILANGNLYFGTTTGLLVCIQLNDPDAKGWHAWGGDENHNRVQ